MTSIGNATKLEAASLQPTDVIPVERPGVTTPYKTRVSSLSLAATGMINVKDYGAVGDGVTDDTAAIQEAIDAANAAYTSSFWTTQRVLVPGIFRVADLILKSGVILSGVGSEHANSSLWGLPGATWIVDTGVDNVIFAGIENLSIMGPATWATNGMGGVRIQNGTKVKIKGVYFNGFANQAIKMGGIANQIRDCFVQNALKNRTRVAASGGIEVTGTDHYLIDTEVTVGDPAYGNQVSSPDMYCAAWLIDAGTCFINNCIGEISDIGFRFINRADYGMVSNSRADLNYGHGFYIEEGANRLQFSNCLALNNGMDTDNTYDGFHYAGGIGARLQFNNCLSSTQSQANRQRYGFYSAESAGSLCSIFNGCLSEGHATGPFGINQYYPSLIGFQTGGQSLTFTDGDTTPSVTPYQMPYSNFMANNTSPTDITNFDNGLEGQIIYVVTWNTNTTFKQGNIKTKTGADVTSTNPGIYCFMLRGGFWFQL